MVFISSESKRIDVSEDLYVIIGSGQLLVRANSNWQPLAENVFNAIDPIQRHYLGELNQQHCFALFYSSCQVTEPPSGFEWQPLRSQLGCVSEELFQLAGRALQITRWYRDHRFCGVCGVATEPSREDRSCICSQCKARFYPRISPCVIGLVRRGEYCLLARGVHTPEGVFSTLAGFVEPGETAEQALAREVFEEVGLHITNIEYFGSQPWPFPGQLMLGYTAEYDGGEICIDENEIVEAQWFHVKKMPVHPPESTIAGKLIFNFIRQCAE
ncbi:MAG: NAD+ diphosphatase [Lentisphaeria bacterium]|jgi:NAD+ diphosphatase